MFTNLRDDYLKDFSTSFKEYRFSLEAKDFRLTLINLAKTMRASIAMLKEYFSLMGLYPVTEKAIIRASHYNEIISDGHSYIRLHHILINKDLKRLNLVKFNDYIKLFEELEQYIKKEINKYGNQT